MRRNLSVVVLVLVMAAPAGARQTGSIIGTILDARDGTPLEKVSVRVQDTKLATLTASDGRFQLDDVPAGRTRMKSTDDTNTSRRPAGRRRRASTLERIAL